MRAIVNGKSVVLPDNATVRDARRQMRTEVGADQFVEGTRLLGDSDRIREGAQLSTIPKIVKG